MERSSQKEDEAIALEGADSPDRQERLLQVRRRVLGQQHHRLPIVGVNLAMIYCNESRLDEVTKLNE